MKKQILLLITLIISYLNIQAKVIYTEKDSTIFESYIKQLTPIKNQPIDKIIVETAIYFLNSPYVESTLECIDNEQLVVNLRQFDCTTFVENCIALAKTVKSESPTFQMFCDNLIKMRYRNGQINGYTSRIHYMTEWIYENQKNGNLQNITLDLGGNSYAKVINFMSAHPDSYINLKDNPENLKKIKEIEEEISQLNTYSYLAKKMILLRERRINNGNIILFSTNIQGLDYTHMGIAFREKSEMHFIHASSRNRKVVIESKTLQNYCLTSTSCNGISVLQIKD